MTLSASSLNKGKNKSTKVSVNTVEKLVNLVQFGDGGDFEVITGIRVEARDLMACLYGQKKAGSLDVLCEHVFANNKVTSGISPQQKIVLLPSIAYPLQVQHMQTGCKSPHVFSHVKLHISGTIRVKEQV